MTLQIQGQMLCLTFKEREIKQWWGPTAVAQLNFTQKLHSSTEIIFDKYSVLKVEREKKVVQRFHFFGIRL